MKHLRLYMATYLPLCFRGVGPGCNTREIADKLIDLKAELDDLALREHELDQQRVWVQQSIKNVTDDSNNSPYPSLHCLCIYVHVTARNSFLVTYPTVSADVICSSVMNLFCIILNHTVLPVYF